LKTAKNPNFKGRERGAKGHVQQWFRGSVVTTGRWAAKKTRKRKGKQETSRRLKIVLVLVLEIGPQTRMSQERRDPEKAKNTCRGQAFGAAKLRANQRKREQVRHRLKLVAAPAAKMETKVGNLGWGKRMYWE